MTVIRRKAWIALTLAVWGCDTAPSRPIDTNARDMLALLLPASLKIVEPFTTLADLQPPPGIDGVRVCVQPLNAAGTPVQTVGYLYVELYQHLPASGERAGTRLGIWDFPLETEADQKTRWNRATEMYELPVVLPDVAGAAKGGDKFLLTVTHHSPLGETRSAEFVLEVPLARQPTPAQP